MIKNILFISLDPVIFRRRVLNQIETALQTGWTAELITTVPRLTTKVDYPIHYINHPFKRGPLRFLYFNYKALRIILKNNFDVIHARGLWVLPALIIARITKRFKLVYDAHEFFAGHELFEKHLWRRLTWLKVEKYAVPRIDVLITVSEPLGNHYRELYPALKSIEIIRSLPKANAYILSKAQREDQFIRLSFHGYLYPGRGLLQILQALAELKNYPFKITFTGEGPLKNQLENITRTSGLTDKVAFDPFVESDKLLEKIHDADLGIVLIEADSINRAHALPNKFFEYIHAAVPVLASNITTLKEYTQKFKVGFVCDPYNKQDIVNTLKNIFDNKALLKEYRLNCIKAAKELSWQNESKKLAAVYLNLFK
jgi:glycosyltransferase involved in cell wall biosynthesis